MVNKRRNYKSDPLSCVMIYLIYLQDGEDAAFEYADKAFGINEGSNWALRRKLQLTNKGGWKEDWLTNMYRDINKVLKKYNAI